MIVAVYLFPPSLLLLTDDGNLVITTADAGSLNLTTEQLVVEQGAKISADTFGRGKGADVSLDVSELTIRDGGIVGAGSLLQPVGFTGEDTSDNIRGDGGTLTVNASKSVEITGTGNIGETQVDSSLIYQSRRYGRCRKLGDRNSQVNRSRIGKY